MKNYRVYKILPTPWILEDKKQPRAQSPDYTDTIHVTISGYLKLIQKESLSVH